MPGDLELDGGTAVDGGVGNGQATGTGHVSESFDMDTAMDSISSGLFGEEATPQDKTPPEAKVGENVTPPAPAPTEKVPEAAAPATTPAPGADVAPKTWKPEEAAVWAQIPPAAKAAIARREEDMFRGIEQHKQTAQFGNTVQEVLKPYMPILQAHNINPVENIKNLMNAHYMLATGTPQQKQQMIDGLIKDYNIQFQAPEVDPYAAPPNPEVEALKQQLQQLQSGQAAREQAEFRQAQAKTMEEVNTFAADPKNVYFDEVTEEMVKLLNADKSLALPDAYEKAVWSNPVTRAKEIARQDAEKQTKLREEATKQVSKARQSTAANLQVQPKAGAATLPLGTMDETMAEAMAAIKARS